MNSSLVKVDPDGTVVIDPNKFKFPDGFIEALQDLLAGRVQTDAVKERVNKNIIKGIYVFDINKMNEKFDFGLLARKLKELLAFNVKEKGYFFELGCFEFNIIEMELTAIIEAMKNGVISNLKTSTWKNDNFLLVKDIYYAAYQINTLMNKSSNQSESDMEMRNIINIVDCVELIVKKVNELGITLENGDRPMLE